MPSISRLDEHTRQDLVDRLKRIEGQARGIQRMIDEGRDCRQVIDQVAALKAATHSVSVELLERVALYCAGNPDAFDSPTQAITEMVGTIMRAGR